jgi:hypothetical protein
MFCLDFAGVALTILRAIHAGIAQLVEHDLAKVGVASSSLVSRSKSKKPRSLFERAGLSGLKRGQVAEWSCSGLQSRPRRFDSDPGLHQTFQRLPLRSRKKQKTLEDPVFHATGGRSRSNSSGAATT